MKRNPIKLRLKIFLLVFASALALGTLGFMLTEKLNIADAFYFTIVTMSTVGYGDVHPTAPLSKVIAVIIIVLGVGTFVGAVSNAMELMLLKRERKIRIEKLNIVIGAFFSELGSRLLGIFSEADGNIETIRKEFLIKKDSPDKEFTSLSEHLRKYRSDILIDRVDLPHVTLLLAKHKDFLLRLLENPNLLESESFTGILWAVFHLAQELQFREDFSALPESDRAHLRGDIQRVYDHLIVLWVEYMWHLKEKYPYLFSLSVRTNPFDQQASVVIAQ